MMQIARRYRLLLLICALGLTGLFFSRASSPVARQGNSQLRIATFNLFYRAHHPESVIKLIRDWDLDIVVFLEYNSKNISRKQMEQAGYRVDTALVTNGAHGIAIFSKKNLMVRAALFHSPVQGPCRMPFALASIRSHGTPVNIIAVHVPPPIPACNDTTDTTIDAVTSWIENGVLRQDVSILEAGIPTIVAGDFNAFPFNRSLAGLRDSGLVDVEKSCVHWLCPTWSPRYAIPALIRIDYIFVPRQITVLKSWTATIQGSDHRAVITELVL